ncbi:MAG: cytochrome c biogenesis heme-transporting ATPase CcmA [Gammaproteobacteria bacterium]|nr:cytochrome c biogenesis heme-transporting ATPase CcmA [Gammaproteobacteria bacterium]
MAHRLDIVDLSCTRGDRPLFSGLGQSVAAGELLHVVGSNGSGKTTLLRTLCGLSQPAAGEVRWRGTSTRALSDTYRQDLTYLGHLDAVQGELTPPENLHALARMAGGSGKIDEALERLGLTAHRSFPAKILSQGQKRRLALARLLVLQKPLWILDEPFTALDARSCRLMTELLAEHLASQGIIVLSSHQDFDMPGAVIKRIDLDQLRHARNRPSA